MTHWPTASFIYWVMPIWLAEPRGVWASEASMEVLVSGTGEAVLYAMQDHCGRAEGPWGPGSAQALHDTGAVKTGEGT